MQTVGHRTACFSLLLTQSKRSGNGYKQLPHYRQQLHYSYCSLISLQGDWLPKQQQSHVFLTTEKVRCQNSISLYVSVWHLRACPFDAGRLKRHSLISPSLIFSTLVKQILQPSGVHSHHCTTSICIFWAVWHMRYNSNGKKDKNLQRW